MNAEDAAEDLIEQSQSLLTTARATLNRAEILVGQAQASRQQMPDALTDREEKTALMVPLLAMQEARKEIVTAIQLTTQAMHHATRYVQAREKFIQARVEWQRKHSD